MRTKNRIYTEEFKWKVVQDVLSGTLTKEEARRVYSIKGNCTILYWMRAFSGVANYCRGGAVAENIEQMAKTSNRQHAAQEIARLKRELRRERMRADLWQKMVEVAEKELGVDIRKKFEAKPSPDADSSTGKPSK